MPFVAANPGRYVGAAAGNGHCVALVRAAAGAPHTASWRRGDRVNGAHLVHGTAIATFDADGRYENDTNGRSHAAIYVAEADDGIWVLDQWLEHPASERLIQYRGGRGKAVDDADAYYVIEIKGDA
jgi:hypothetical protein